MFMMRPKWLDGWGEGRNLLEARLLIDIPDIRVVESSYDRKLLFIGIGTVQKPESGPSTQTDGKYDERKSKDLEWRIFYDSTVIPQSMSMDCANNLMAGIISALAESESVFHPSTVYISSGRSSKGNAPLLLDYEMAKKIEEAKTERRI